MRKNCLRAMLKSRVSSMSGIKTFMESAIMTRELFCTLETISSNRTRYNKRSVNFLGAVYLATIMVWPHCLIDYMP